MKRRHVELPAGRRLGLVLGPPGTPGVPPLPIVVGFPLTATPSGGAITAAHSLDGGVTWQSVSVPVPAVASVTWLAVAYSTKLKRFLAVGETSTVQRLGAYSDDGGFTWVNTSANMSTYVDGDAVYSADYDKFYAVNQSGSATTLQKSSDGVSWSAQALPSSLPGIGLGAGNNQVLVPFHSGAFNSLSNNGAAFSVVTLPSSSTNFNHPVWNGTRWIAPGSGSSSVAISTDGSTWGNATAPAAVTGYFTAATNRAGIDLVAGTGSGNGQTNSCAISTDGGLTFTNVTLSSAPQGKIYDVCWTGSLFVLTAPTAAVVMTSPNGSTWTTRTPPLAIARVCANAAFSR